MVNQAHEAMYLILKKAHIQKLPIDVQLDLFHNMVLPILLYSSEVWGIENNDLIIKLHVEFCKHILHCKTSTPTFSPPPLWFMESWEKSHRLSKLNVEVSTGLVC